MYRIVIKCVFYDKNAEMLEYRCSVRIFCLRTVPLRHMTAFNLLLFVLTFFGTLLGEHISTSML